MRQSENAAAVERASSLEAELGTATRNLATLEADMVALQAPHPTSPPRPLPPRGAMFSPAES